MSEAKRDFEAELEESIEALRAFSRGENNLVTRTAVAAAIYTREPTPAEIVHARELEQELTVDVQPSPFELITTDYELALEHGDYSGREA